MKIDLVTVANKRPAQEYYLWDEMHQSLMKYGASAHILGLGEPWGGLMTKPRKLRNWLREQPKDESHIIIYFDAYDVVFVDDPKEIVKEFLKIRGDNRIIWNAERSLFPDATLKFPDHKSSFKYLNSGFAVGYALAFLETLEWMNLDEIADDHRKSDGTMWEPNDQLYIQKAFLEGPVKMGLDYNCNLCQCVCGTEEKDYEVIECVGPVIKIRNKETQSIPKVFHNNGPAKTSSVGRKIVDILRKQF